MLALVASLLFSASGGWVDDCGLEPPGSWVPREVPKKPYEETWHQGDPPLVRRERSGPTPRNYGVPNASLKGEGVLAGKVVYLSAGHGFTWTQALTPPVWQTQRPTTNQIVEDLVSTESVHQFLVPMLENAGAQVITVREPDLNSRLVIVDDGTAGYVETGAGFSDSSLAGWGAPANPMATGVNPFALAKNRLMTAAPTATASATYTANFPADGYYNVYVSYSAFTARVTDAHYVVKHAGGDSHFRVNQRRHGGTWILLGNFYFKQGSAAAVVVQNDSQDTGNVSLDAVRFGGGMGLIDRGGGVSGRPRFEECSRYHAQYAGAPTAVYGNSNDDHTDDVATRSNFAAWVHEPGEDAVFLSWHTNAFNASAVGTTIYVYGPNPPDGTYQFTGVPGSDKLAQFVHSELINDIRASGGWNKPAWQDRGIDSAYFGEINPAHNNEMPSILMEIAFHDAAADATQLKEPGFRYLATRAISQGIIRFFADKDGTTPTFPPEPPTHLAALNQPGGMVKLQWHAPVVDSQGVGGAAATKYRVYASADGLAWDDGVEVTSPSFTAALPAGQARFFRVASLNAGGESFPSEVVGARAPEPGGKTVLVVNAYDRLDAGLGHFDDLSAWSLGQVLRIFLRKMNDAAYVGRWGDAIDRAKVGFDSATTLAVTSGDVTLASYAMVGWMGGRGHAGGAGPSASEQTALSTWQQAGKPLFFTSTNAARALAAGSAADQAFLSSVLRIGAASSSTAASVDGVDFLAGLPAMTFDDGTAGAYDTAAVDVLTGSGGSTRVATYAGGTSAAFAAPGAAVTFGFPFETIVSRPQRVEVMARVLKYFNVVSQTPPPPDGGPEVPDAGVDAGVDAGPPPDITLPVLPNEYAAPPKQGCGCSMADAFSPLLLLALYRLIRARTAR